MAKLIKIVAGNSAPPIVLTLEREGTAIDVTGATVELIIKGSSITNAGHQTCVLTTPASGIVTYTPHTADFSTSGTYKADAKITYNDGSVEILYDQVKFKARAKLS